MKTIVNEIRLMRAEGNKKYEQRGELAFLPQSKTFDAGEIIEEFEKVERHNIKLNNVIFIGGYESVNSLFIIYYELK